MSPLLITLFSQTVLRVVCTPMPQNKKNCKLKKEQDQQKKDNRIRIHARGGNSFVVNGTGGGFIHNSSVSTTPIQSRKFFRMEKVLVKGLRNTNSSSLSNINTTVKTTVELKSDPTSFQHPEVKYEAQLTQSKELCGIEYVLCSLCTSLTPHGREYVLF